MRPRDQLEAADPDAFDPSAYIDRTGEEALAATEGLLLGMGAKKLGPTEFVYDDLHMVKGPVGIDPVWTVHWNSWFRTWPETRGIAKVLQSRLQDFVNEYQRLIDDDYDHKRAFTLAREHLKESVDPDDPASFIARVEQPEDVLRELGFVNLRHQPVWSRDDGSVRTVVEKADATHWRVTSWMPGSKHTLPVMKEFDWFDLRKGIEWALPRTAKWARPGSTDWAVNLAHKALGEAADPDDIDVGNYLAVGDPTFTKLYHMGFELVPETDADIEHMALMLHSNLIIKVYKNVADGYYARLEDETGVGCLGSFATKQGGRVVGQIRQWIKEHSKRWHQMRESADPDDIDPKRYLDDISSHELLDTSTPGGSSRSTCCTCGKWCFSGLVRDEAERLDFENNLKTEWERHRYFATEYVEPCTRNYMLLAGTPYRWGESADPDEIDPQRYVDEVSKDRMMLHAANFRQVSKDRWVRDRRHTTVEITNMGRSGWMLTIRGHAWSTSTQYMTLHGAIYANTELRESADPDDIDPQRYLSAIRVVWVIKWNDAYYEANSHSHGHFAGGEWKLKPDHATRWVSREAAQSWFDKNLRPWYQNAEVVPVERRLSESADPDDINPEHYLDAVASTAGPLELRARLQDAFRGSFMRPEYYFSGYREVETNAGTYIVPADVMDSDDPDDYLDYVEGRINEVSERREGWVYRTSASGYMDASDWGAAGSEEEAIDALIDNYGDADAGLEDGLEESADPDDVDPKQWLDNIALSRERLREIIRGIPRTFHIGFSIRCSTPEDDEVEAAAQEERVNVDLAWEAINEDWPRIERNVQKWMSSHGIISRSEGHDGDGDLVGSVFIDLAVPTNFDFFEQYMQHEEPWRTSSGTFPNEADVYADTSVFSHLIDVDLDLFDYAKCEVAFEHMVDSGVTLKKLNGVWTGVSPARDVDEAADPDEPNMARWVERLSAEAQLDRIFNEQGMPYFRDDPKGATNWSRWFRWGEFEVWTTFTIFHKGENAPSGHLSYEIKHGSFQHKNSEFVRGPDNILKMIDLFDRALAGLNQTPPKKVSDIIRAFETPLRWAYSMERYGEDTA